MTVYDASTRFTGNVTFTYAHDTRVDIGDIITNRHIGTLYGPINNAAIQQAVDTANPSATIT
jgi:hypothetical protein